MTIRIAGAMVSVIIAIAIVAAVGFAIDILDLEHEPVGIALAALVTVAAIAFVVVRLCQWWRAAGRHQHPGSTG
jgi:membrane protein DedA with SNARE-associated domain